MITRKAVSHTTLPTSPNRRSFLGALLAVGGAGRLSFGFPCMAEGGRGTGAGAAFDSPLPTKTAATDGDDSIRPFHVNFLDAAIVDLRGRIAATNWPERESVTDAS